MKRYYLAYGSNLNLQQMAKRCPRSAPVGTAVLEGFALLFKGSPTRGFYLTVEPKGEAKTPVGVWEIDDGDLPALDRYEGYPALYYKRSSGSPSPSGPQGKPSTATLSSTSCAKIEPPARPPAAISSPVRTGTVPLALTKRRF